MNAPLSLLLAWIGAMVAAVLLCRVVMVLGVKDAPTEARKLQKAPVPTAGGLGFSIAALGAAWFAAQVAGIAVSPVVLVLGAAGMAAMLLGLIDDKRSLNAKLKLGAMLLIAVGAAWAGVRADAMQPWPGALAALPFAVAVGGSALWLLVVMNAVNFMDGANGLAMGMAMIAALALSACAAIGGAWDVALLGAGLAGGLAGFLVWNLPGRLFAGDAGALFVGTMLAGLSLLLVARRPDWLLAPPLILLPFLSDVLLTLAWRATKGKKLFVAHRDHAYQIAMKAGLKHWQVSGVHAVWAINAAVIGVMSVVVGGHAVWGMFVALLAASVWMHLRVRRSGEAAGLVGADIP